MKLFSIYVLFLRYFISNQILSHFVMRKKTLLNITHDRKRIKISAQVCVVSYVYFKDMFIPKYRLLRLGKYLIVFWGETSILLNILRANFIFVFTKLSKVNIRVGTGQVSSRNFTTMKFFP